MDTFFELGKAKAAKGEGWAPPFISCAQDTVGLTPLPLWLLGYGKALPHPKDADGLASSWKNILYLFSYKTSTITLSKLLQIGYFNYRMGSFLLINNSKDQGPSYLCFG